MPLRWGGYCRYSAVTVGWLLPLRWASYCRYGRAAIAVTVGRLLPLRWAGYCRYGGLAIAVTVGRLLTLRWAGYCRYDGSAIAVTLGGQFQVFLHLGPETLRSSFLCSFMKVLGTLWRLFDCHKCCQKSDSVLVFQVCWYLFGLGGVSRNANICVACSAPSVTNEMRSLYDDALTR